MRTGITIKQPNGNLYQPEKENNTMAIQATDQIKVGDYVRLHGDNDHVGKVTKTETRRVLTVLYERDGLEASALEEAFEPVPRRTPDEAWEELPYLILNQVNSQRAYGAKRLHEYDQKIIRHECYKLLGGSGIKVTEEVKERVRKAIARIASELGIELT